MTINYPWYKVVEADENLRQGDMFKNCPITIPQAAFSIEKPNATEIPVTVEMYDVIVLSQSCDLEHKKIQIVLVCPFWNLEEFAEQNSLYNCAEAKEGLRRGNAPGYHLLNKCDISQFKTDFLVVDFRNVFGVNYDYLEELTKKSGKRLRLLPPYREHLSQAFARFFMRVGLPVDIPKFV